MTVTGEQPPGEPRVYVGPDAPEILVQAARDAGAALVDDPAHAAGIVWYGGSPADLVAVLTPAVRWVQLPAAGVESWVDSGVLGADRVVTSATGSYGKPVAEHALAVMLAGARQLPELARATTWSRTADGGTLFGAVVGIIGAGGIGRALIALLEPFHARVLAVTRSGAARPVPGAERTFGPEGTAEVLADSDFVVVAAPATAATRALIGAPELALMKPTAWLVNVARGSLVDSDALVDALRAGRIAGAALDVTDPEPLPDGHPLWTEPRALITPHSANPEPLHMPFLAERVRHNVAAFLAGEPLEGIIEAERGY